MKQPLSSVLMMSRRFAASGGMRRMGRAGEYDFGAVTPPVTFYLLADSNSSHLASDLDGSRLLIG